MWLHPHPETPAHWLAITANVLAQPCKISTMSYFKFVDQLPQLAFTVPHSSTDSIQLFLQWPQHRHILSLYINFKLVFVKLSGLLLNMDGFWDGLDLIADSWEVGCSEDQCYKFLQLHVQQKTGSYYICSKEEANWTSHTYTVIVNRKYLCIYQVYSFRYQDIIKIKSSCCQVLDEQHVTLLHCVIN